jgi:hypothetical protein
MPHIDVVVIVGHDGHSHRKMQIDDKYDPAKRTGPVEPIVPLIGKKYSCDSDICEGLNVCFVFKHYAGLVMRDVNL